MLIDKYVEEILDSNLNIITIKEGIMIKALSDNDIKPYDMAYIMILLNFNLTINPLACEKTDKNTSNPTYSSWIGRLLKVDVFG